MTPASLPRKRVLGVDPANVHMELVRHDLLHLIALVLAQQTVIHEDTGQLIAHGTLQQGGGHGAVHAAGQSQQHTAAADLGPALRPRPPPDRTPWSTRRLKPQMPYRGSSAASPCRTGCGVPPGGTARRKAASRRTGWQRERQPSVEATTSKPGASVSTSTPWLIQYTAVAGMSLNRGLLPL